MIDGLDSHNFSPYNTVPLGFNKWSESLNDIARDVLISWLGTLIDFYYLAPMKCVRNGGAAWRCVVLVLPESLDQWRRTASIQASYQKSFDSVRFID